MSLLAAMTLPALVVLLVVAGAIEAVVVRRKRRRGEAPARSHVAATGFDVLGLALAPTRQAKLEHDEYQRLRRDEEGDAAPRRSSVDLESGVARLVVPPPAEPAPGARDAAGQ